MEFAIVKFGLGAFMHKLYLQKSFLRYGGHGAANKLLI